MQLTDAEKLTVKIIETYENVRRISGADYGDQSREWKEIVRAGMMRHQCSALAAVPQLVKELLDAGFDPAWESAWLTAAAVDIEVEQACACSKGESSHA